MAKRVEKIISVGGGKGGVGKSVIAGNISVAMAQEGVRVVLVDGDLGAANQHTLFGIPRPGPTLQALIDQSVDSLEQIRVPTAVPNLTLIPGSTDVVGAANVTTAQKLKLIRHIRKLEADVVVIDVGAGVGYNVLDLFDAADLRLVVMLPQLTSVENGYGFLKGAVFRELRRFAADRKKADLVDGSPEAKEATRTVTHLLTRLRGVDEDLAGALQGCLTGFGARIAGNQVFDAKERNVFFAISRMAQDFLGLDAPVLGILRASRRIHDSISTGRPFLLDETGEESAVAIRQIARALLSEDVKRLRQRREEVEKNEALAVAKATEESGPLPAALQRYERAFERQPVDCPGTLVIAGTSMQVRLRDISLGGALLEMDRPPLPGSRAVLVLSDVEGRPTLACSIRHASAELRRAGVEFLVEQSVARRVTEMVTRQFPAPHRQPED